MKILYKKLSYITFRSYLWSTDRLARKGKVLKADKEVVFLF